MKHFKEYISEAPVQSNDFKDRLANLTKLIKEQIESFDPKMSPDAKKGEKIVGKMQDGTYELIYHITSVPELESYAKEALNVSFGDFGDEDEDSYEENMETWKMVKDNAEEIVMFNHHSMTSEEYARIQKVLQGTLKRLK